LSGAIRKHSAVLWIVLAVVIGLLVLFVVRKSRGKSEPPPADTLAG
jgi:hypothetical protein